MKVGVFHANDTSFLSRNSVLHRSNSSRTHVAERKSFIALTTDFQTVTFATSDFLFLLPKIAESNTAKYFFLKKVFAECNEWIKSLYKDPKNTKTLLLYLRGEHHLLLGYTTE